MVSAEAVEAPNNKISYFPSGKVKSITHFCAINNWTVGETTYERKGNKLFVSVFDEHHGIYRFNDPVKTAELPEEAKTIFQAGEREKIIKLMEEDKIQNYIEV